jgi:hypothetical protein
MVPILCGQEVFIAGSSGLARGLASAATLADFGLDPRTLASSVLGFSLGIEAFQLLVILMAMRWLVLLARSHVYRLFRMAGAALTGIAATAWFAERALGWNNPIAPLVEGVASHALWLLASVVVLTVAATVAEDAVKASRRTQLICHSGESNAAV